MKNSLMGLFLAVISSGVVFAADESITITTYYPSPAGVYKNLKVVQNMTFAPQNAVPPVAGAQDGQFAYVDTNTADTTPGRFYFYSAGAGAWQQQASSGTSVYSTKCTGGPQASGLISCSPPGCAAGWTSLGTGCALTGVAYNTNFANMWYVGYCEQWCAK